MVVSGGLICLVVPHLLSHVRAVAGFPAEQPPQLGRSAQVVGTMRLVLHFAQHYHFSVATYLHTTSLHHACTGLATRRLFTQGGVTHHRGGSWVVRVRGRVIQEILCRSCRVRAPMLMQYAEYVSPCASVCRAHRSTPPSQSRPFFYA